MGKLSVNWRGVLALGERITSSKRTIGIIVAVTSLGFGVIAGLEHQHINNQEASVRTVASTTKTAQLRAAEKARQQASAVAKPANSSTTTSAPTASAVTTKQAAPTIKYSTSSDPRSTAYSTTPPTSNPTSFDIPITHSDQVASGTVITYSATKGERTYYAGDLILSPTSVVLSHSMAATPPFTIAIPDGQVSGAPSTPWNDTNHSVFPSFSASPSPGTTWNMFAALYAGSVPNGTYTIHLVSTRGGPSADSWQYHGFLTVTVTD